MWVGGAGLPLYKLCRWLQCVGRGTLIMYISTGEAESRVEVTVQKFGLNDEQARALRLAAYHIINLESGTTNTGMGKARVLEALRDWYKRTYGEGQERDGSCKFLIIDEVTMLNMR